MGEEEKQKPVSPVFLPPDERPEPPLSGRAYGEIAYWIALVGLVIGITGLGLSFTGNTLMDSTEMVNDLWAKKDIEALWKDAADRPMPESGFWFLNYLTAGDGLAMLGIAIISTGAIIGMWAMAAVKFVKAKDILFAVFAVIVGIVMLLSAAGIVSH